MTSKRPKVPNRRGTGGPGGHGWALLLAISAAALLVAATFTTGVALAKRSDNLVTFTTSADFERGTSTNLGLPVGLAPASSYGELRLGGVTPSWSLYSSWNAPSQGNKTYTSPTLADLNDDGLVDLLVGKADGTTIAYQNTGSPGSPVWTRQPAWDPPAMGAGQYAVPTLADLNGDGLLDLAIGRYDQSVWVYENTGSSAGPAWTRQPTWDPPALSGTNHAAPAFADLNLDGLVDLVIGANNDHNLAYQNTGTPTAPVWTRQPAWDTPAEASRGWTEIAFADLNGDQLPDLFLGDSRGTISVYQNTGSPSGPVWTLNTSWNPPQITQYATPALANLDDDRDLDLMVGSQRGTLDCVRNYDAGSTTPGQWLSPVIDAGADGMSWTEASWTEHAAGTGASLTVELRSAATPADLAAAAWLPLAQGELPIPAAGRYAQARVTFTTSVPTSTEVLEQLSLRAVPGLAVGPWFEDRRTLGVAWQVPIGVSAASYDILRNGAPIETTADQSLLDHAPAELLGTQVTYTVLARDATGHIVAAGAGVVRYGKRQF